jgi:hypothetical protein
MRVHTNNLSSTVLQLFLDAIQQYGIPMHMRGDRGRENVDVSIWMIRCRGAYCAAFLWGRSVQSCKFISRYNVFI